MKLNQYYIIPLFLTLFSLNSVAALSDHFVTTWNTEIPGQSNASSITIKTKPGLTYSYNIDWDNDGVFDELAVTGDVAHSFTTPGIKTIRISGDFPAILSQYNNDISKLISIDRWGTNPWKTMNHAFYNAKNLVNKASDTPNLSQCTDLNSMFANALKIGKSTEIANWNWDVSNITSMQGMFGNAASFNQNISGWLTTNVENLSHMFNNAKSFNQDLSLWNIQNVTNFTNIFKAVNLSITNYDNLLASWSPQSSNQNLFFHGGKSIYYSQAAQSAHENLTANLNWTIEDGGLCEPQLTIISNSTTRLDEGESTVMRIITSDPDFDVVTYSISGGEDQATFSINPSSGLLTFNNPPDFENPIDADGNNIYILQVTATDDGNPIETVSQTITVFINNIYENLPSDDFVTTWKTDNLGNTSSTSITLPIYSFTNSNASYDVDWNNDGVFDEFDLTTVVTHDYGSPGIKTIRVRATSPYLFFRLGGDHKKLVSIDQWGTIPWGILYRAFYEAENLIINASDVPNLSACKNISFMFYGAKSVGGITETSNWNWDTSTINNFSSLFNGATNFNQNIGNWDTSSIEYSFQDFPNSGFYQMFKDATSFNQNIGDWDTSNAYIMASMFENAVSFNQNLEQWDIHRVAYFNDMFKNTSLSSQNYDALLNSWSTQNVRTDVEFGAGKSIYCSATAAASRDSLINNNNWTIYDQGQCLPALNIVSPQLVFVDENQTEIITIKTTDPDYDSVTFTITGGDDQLLFSLDSSTGELTFVNPPNYENPLDLDDNNSYIVEVTATDDGMPQESSTQIISIYINNVYENLANDDFITTWKTDNPGRSNDTSIIIKTSSHYEYLYDVDWNNDGVFDEVGITGDSAHDYGIASTQTIRIRGQFPSIRFYQDYDQEKLISIDQWGTISWRTMLFAFSDTANLIINATDTPNLSSCDSLAAMFNNSPLVGSETETSNWNWNTSNITNMRNMFKNAISFNKDIGQWDTSRVDDMQYMFDNAHSFNQDIGSWDTSNVEIMYRLFKDAYSFNQDLSQWNITRNTEFRDIFNNVSLSFENYDALLIGWNQQIISPNLTFDGGNSLFCSQQAVDAHNNLMTTHGWTIYDKGQCKNTLTVITNDVVFVDENTTPVIQIVATNADFDNISYAITGGDDQAFFNLDALTGELSFITPQDYENPLDFNHDNAFFVEVTASDDGVPQEFVTQSLTIYIKNRLYMKSSG